MITLIPDSLTSNRESSEKCPLRGAAKLLAIVPGGNGVTAGASTPAHSANMLVLATLMLTTVEAAPLAAIAEAPPVSALLSDLEVSDLRLHHQHLHHCTTNAPPSLPSIRSQTYHAMWSCRR